MSLYNIVDSTAVDPHRILTGIEFIDHATNGGFVCPGTYLLTGDSNAGKSTLSAQIGDGVTKSGDICLFVSLEMIEAQFKYLIKRLRLRHGFMVDFEKDQTDIMRNWRDLHRAHPNKKILMIIDSLQSLARDDNALATLLRFDEKAKQFNTSLLFIGQATKAGEYRGSSTLQHEVTGHLHMSVEKNDGQQIRKIEMRKNRAGPCESVYTELGEYGHRVTDYEDLI